MPFSQIIPPSPSPSESKSLLYTFDLIKICDYKLAVESCGRKKVVCCISASTNRRCYRMHMVAH